MKLFTGSILLASTMLVPLTAQGQTIPGDTQSGQHCRALVNYLQEYPNYDFPVELDEARELARDGNQQACIDRMREINVSLGYDDEDAAAPSVSDTLASDDMRPGDAMDRRGEPQLTREDSMTPGSGISGARDQSRPIITEERAPRRDTQVTRLDAAEQRQAGQRNRDQGEAEIVVQQRPPRVSVDQVSPSITVEQTAPRVSVQQPKPEIFVHQPAPRITVDIPQPQITVRMPQPEVDVQTTRPQVSVRQPEPQVRVAPAGQPSVEFEAAEADIQYRDTGEPAIQIRPGEEASVRYEREEAQVRVNQPRGEPQIRFEQADEGAGDRQQTQRVGNRGTGLAASEPLSRQEQQRRVSAGAVDVTNLVGSTVYGSEGEEVGDVSEMLFSADGRVEAVVIDVGGFLGLGEKPVVVSYSALTIRGGENGEDRMVTARLSREDFDQAREYSREEYSRDPNAVMLR